MLRMRWFSSVLVIALVLAQALGAMHRVVHAHAAQAVAQGDGPGWVQDLFAAHEDTTCQLLDAIGHDGIPSAFSLAGFAPPALRQAVLDAEPVARLPALVRARGPPASFVS